MAIGERGMSEPMALSTSSETPHMSQHEQHTYTEIDIFFVLYHTYIRV